jgi:SAM-dependent methyltransferase
MPRECPACGDRRLRPHYEGMHRCSGCGHVFVDHDLGPADFEKLYERGYFFGEEYVDYVADQAVLQRNFASRLEVLRRFLPPGAARSLLEIGCAYGWFLELVKHEFSPCRGIDITADGVATARARGLDAVQGDVLTADLGTAPYDVVCLWDTIEHLPHPERTLARARELTRPGSIVALTTGDIGSLMARVRGRRWRLIHPPTHLHYFTRPSVRAMLRRNGFEVLHLEACGFYRSVRNMSHNLLELRSPRLAPAHAWLVRRGLGKAMIYLNLFDIMYVVARRD